MKLSGENEKRLRSLLWNAIPTRGLTYHEYHEGDCADVAQLHADLLERNGILLADMMYNFGEFPKGFVPVDLGKEYYALFPEELAMKSLTLGHLDLK